MSDRYIPNRIVQSVIKHAEARALRLGEPPPSQQDKIMTVLRYSPEVWVCGASFLEAYMPTYSQRIGELIRDGAPITRAGCTNPGHKHRSTLAQYKLERT